MKVGIFFGGPSREREVSFAGGRTALTHLDQSLFEPVLVFVDGLGNFIHIQKEALQAESIRNLYPRQSDNRFRVYIESLADGSPEEIERQIGAVGKRLKPEDFRSSFDLVFLAMHGPDCEDGGIQGLLEWYKIPYTGPGLLGSAVGINKILQNELIALVNGQEKKTSVINREAWDKADKAVLFGSLQSLLGLPIVVKAPHQGSSIGVSIVREDDLDAFEKAVDQCFFRKSVKAGDWRKLSGDEKIAFIQEFADLDVGIGFPLVQEESGEVIYHPSVLLDKLNEADGTTTLTSVHAEDEVLFEEFIRGQEFSCGVIQDDDGTAVALPPTEIYNVTSFDFKSKYQSSTTRKRIPVDTSLENNRKIQLNVADVFTRLGMNVCARIDGFLTPDGRVLLHDPNTIPGMSPTSLIFKQMAEIGLNVTQAITYFIRQSLRERIRTGKDTVRLRRQLADLDARIAESRARELPEEEIVVNAASAEADEEWARAKARFGPLAAGGQVRPVVVLASADGRTRLPLNLLFKDTLQEAREALQLSVHPLIAETRERAKTITDRFS